MSILVALLVPLGILIGWWLCSRAQVALMDAARAVNRISADSADKLLANARREADLAAQVKRLEEAVVATAEVTKDCARTIDKLDVTIGGLFSALADLGVLRSHRRGGSTAGEMTGEGEPHAPPLTQRTQEDTR